jgi:hypothetical protein
MLIRSNAILGRSGRHDKSCRRFVVVSATSSSEACDPVRGRRAELIRAGSGDRCFAGDSGAFAGDIAGLFTHSLKLRFLCDVRLAALNLLAGGRAKWRVDRPSWNGERPYVVK